MKKETAEKIAKLVNSQVIEKYRPMEQLRDGSLLQRTSEPVEAAVRMGSADEVIWHLVDAIKEAATDPANIEDMDELELPGAFGMDREGDRAIVLY